ncbi:MAG: ATP-grasp domain-containing protein [Candidatus Anstonellales archaeon]
MARIYEYQGKEILSRSGILVPRGRVVSNAKEAREASQEIGFPLVIKAQVWATGRFKAGGILFPKSPEEVEEQARSLLESKIKGLPVEKILIEEQLNIQKEFYTGVIVDSSYKIKGPVIIFSSAGGTNIEEVAAKHPKKIITLPINYLEELTAKKINQWIAKLPEVKSLTPKIQGELSKIILTLYQCFKQYDARAAEINPLVLTKDKKLYAADCRMTIDDNSVFRHPEFGIKLPRDMERPPTPLEEIAWQIEADDYRGTGYFTQMVPQFEGKGWLGFHGIGGGGAMLGASAFVARGFKIANYADTSGDPTASKIYRVVKCILSQPVDGYVLMGACLANQEQWHHAHALVKIFKEEAPKRKGFPVIILLAGNKEKEAHEIIRQGFKNLPLRWELYGRDYIYNTDFIADRVEALVKEYQKEKEMDK